MKKTLKKIVTLTLAIGMLGTAVLTGCTPAKGGASSESTKTDSSTNTNSSVQTDTGKKSEFDTTNDITVTSREDGSGTRGAFVELFEILVKDESGNKTDKTTVEAVIANKTDVMLTGVANDEYAIGYVSLGSLNDTVKALSIDGAEATAENVKSGEYKISRPFMIATKGEADGATKDFISFILSKEGQEVVSNGYIAIDENAASYTKSEQKGKIVVAGSSSVTPIMEKLKEAYIKLNPDVEIEVQQSDSTAGMTGTLEGTCDIGMASRELKDSEKEALNGIAIANDGIAVIVNTKNSMSDASKEDIKNIFTGEVTAWDEVIK